MLCANDRRSFDQAAIEAYQNDPLYDYQRAIPQRSLLDQLMSWLLELLSPVLGGPNAEIMLTWLIRLVLLLGLGMAIFFVLKMRYGSVITSSDRKIFYPSVDSNGGKVDYQHLLAVAQKEGDLKQVLRYSYLSTLDSLSRKRAISYTPWKTSREYLYELSGRERDIFRDLSEIFEAVWYGHLQVDPQLVDQSESLRKKLTDD